MNLFNRDKMVPLPFDLKGPDNDLNEKLDRQISAAIADEKSILYAFGQRWGPEPKPGTRSSASCPATASTTST